MSWPDDADGDVLRRLRADGFDFRRKYSIDFNIDFRSWSKPAGAWATARAIYPSAELKKPMQKISTTASRRLHTVSAH